jgi:hypothetical protein
MGTERLNRAAQAAGYALAGYEEGDDLVRRKREKPHDDASRQPKLAPIKPPQTLVAWLTGLVFPQAGATS